jgi:hypothetical protein
VFGHVLAPTALAHLVSLEFFRELASEPLPGRQWIKAAGMRLRRALMRAPTPAHKYAE